MERSVADIHKAMNEQSGEISLNEEALQRTIKELKHKVSKPM